MTRKQVVWVSVALVVCCGGGLAYYFVATTIGRSAVQFAMGSRLNALTQAALAYAQDNDDALPPRLAFASQTRPYLQPFIERNHAEGDWSAFRMNAYDAGPTLGNTWLESKRLSDVQDPSNTVLFYTTPSFADGNRWAGFVDGKVREARGRTRNLLGADHANGEYHGEGMQDTYPRPPVPVRRTSPMTYFLAVSILCLAGLLLFPVFACGCSRARPVVASMSDLKQLVFASMLYSGDYDDRLPPRMSSGTAAGPYLSNYLFPNPSDSHRLDEILHSRSPNKLPWKGNGRLAGMKVGEVKQPEKTIVFCDGEDWTDGRRLAGFLDGHVKVFLGGQVVDAIYRHGYVLQPESGPLPVR